MKLFFVPVKNGYLIHPVLEMTGLGNWGFSKLTEVPRLFLKRTFCCAGLSSRDLAVERINSCTNIPCVLYKKSWHNLIIYIFFVKNEVILDLPYFRKQGKKWDFLKNFHPPTKETPFKLAVMTHFSPKPLSIDTADLLALSIGLPVLDGSNEW